MSARIQCKASPVPALAMHTLAEHPGLSYRARTVPTEDAVQCLHCGTTFVGGPTVEVTDPEQIANDRRLH